MIAKLFNNTTQTISLWLMVFSMSGCAVGPDFHSPKPPKANRYTFSPLNKKTASTKGHRAGKAQYFNYTRRLPAKWWHLFHSVALDSLIKQGLEHNQSLKEAEKSLAVAYHTLLAQTGSLMFPAIDLNLGAAQAQTSGLQYGSGFPVNRFSIFNTQVQTSYTFDVFGKNRRQIEAYRAKLDYQRYQLLATYLTLTANITTTAITVASLKDQLKATKALITTEQKILAIQQAQQKLGGISQEEVYTQETLLAQTQALLPPLEKSLAAENSTLAVLTGNLTSKFKPLSIRLADLSLPAHLPVSLPSKLVKQRPDILSAEAQLHEMSANIGVATANLLPNISLAASYGWIAGAPANLFIPASTIWNIGGSLVQHVFNGANYVQQRKTAISQFKQYYAKYQEVVLNAFKNVSDSLYAIDFDAKRYKADKKAETSAQHTLATAASRYKLGGQNYLTVMTAQQKYLQNKINRIKSQALRLNDTAALFQALGGGWWHISNQQHFKKMKKRFSTKKLALTHKNNAPIKTHQVFARRKHA